MSNKTQLQTNNDKLSELIQTLQTKGSGGAVLENCTVTMKALPGTITYQSVENGVSEYKTSALSSYSEITLSVQKGTLLHMLSTESATHFYSSSGCDLETAITIKIGSGYAYPAFIADDGFIELYSDSGSGGPEIT